MISIYDINYEDQDTLQYLINGDIEDIIEGADIDISQLKSSTNLCFGDIVDLFMPTSEDRFMAVKNAKKLYLLAYFKEHHLLYFMDNKEDVINQVVNFVDTGVDVCSDFITYRNQIIEKFGETNSDQLELFFERATVEAKKGVLLSAIQDAKFALQLSHYQSEKPEIAFLYGFLSQLHLDINDIEKSKAYYAMGLKRLDPEDITYDDDLEMFERLKEMIDSESWKG